MAANTKETGCSNQNSHVSAKYLLCPNENFCGNNVRVAQEKEQSFEVSSTLFAPQNLCLYEFLLPNDADSEDLLVVRIEKLNQASFFFSYGMNKKNTKGGELKKTT